MARTHERVERWDIPPETDHWDSIRAADAYLRLRIGLDEEYTAAVYDERGQIFEDDLFKAYKEWQKDPSTLKSVVILYGHTARPLSAQLVAKDLQHPAVGGTWKPSLDVTVKGTDVAEVHGIAQEAVRKAKRGLEMPKIEVPEVALPMAPTRAEIPDVSEHVALTPSRLNVVVNHPYAVQIIGGLIVGLILLTLTLWLT